MRYLKLTNNQIFREFKCGLSLEETASLCFKQLSTIERWDRGEEIPPECKRLMRMYSNRELGMSSDWDGFELIGDELKTPFGRYVNAKQMILALALLEIDSESDRRTCSLVVKLARSLASSRGCNCKN